MTKVYPHAVSFDTPTSVSIQRSVVMQDNIAIDSVRIIDDLNLVRFVSQRSGCELCSGNEKVLDRVVERELLMDDAQLDRLRDYDPSAFEIENREYEVWSNDRLSLLSRSGLAWSHYGVTAGAPEDKPFTALLEGSLTRDNIVDVRGSIIRNVDGRAVDQAIVMELPEGVELDLLREEVENRPELRSVTSTGR